MDKTYFYCSATRVVAEQESDCYTFKPMECVEIEKEVALALLVSKSQVINKTNLPIVRVKSFIERKKELITLLNNCNSELEIQFAIDDFNADSEFLLLLNQN